MADVQVASTSPLFVGWSCRRCGHTGGSARCTIPVVLQNLTAADRDCYIRYLVERLKLRLVVIHARESVARGQPCVATYEDFVVSRGGIPEEKTLIGLV